MLIEIELIFLEYTLSLFLFHIIVEVFVSYERSEEDFLCNLYKWWFNIFEQWTKEYLLTWMDTDHNGFIRHRMDMNEISIQCDQILQFLIDDASRLVISHEGHCSPNNTSRVQMSGSVWLLCKLNHIRTSCGSSESRRLIRNCHFRKFFIMRRCSIFILLKFF